MEKANKCDKLASWIKENVTIKETILHEVDVDMAEDGKVRRIVGEEESYDGGYIIKDGDFETGTSRPMLYHIVKEHWKDAGFENEDAARKCVFQ